MTRPLAGLDFETYGDVNLPKHGLARYVDGPTFTPLLASFVTKSVEEEFDFVRYPRRHVARFRDLVEEFVLDADGILVAHNVGFERAVLRRMSIDPDVLPNMVDSAVISRAMGAASSLEGASNQLTDLPKMEEGKRLIQKFSVPNEGNSWQAPTPELVQSSRFRDDWALFRTYCTRDARASLLIAQQYLESGNMIREIEREWLTAQQNERGWFVDLPLVREMQLRYEANIDQALSDFQRIHDPDGKLNLASPMQLKKWCEERGIRAKSFDKENVERMHKVIEKKLITMDPTNPKYQPLTEVFAMLSTKIEMGGSSLKKLQVLIDQTSEDGRLRNQYVHIGAGQSYRTSGRGAQLQNLKRLGGEMLDMDTVYEETAEIGNTELGENLRQVFRAQYDDGELIVGDFSSVESRGLAWVAGAGWKVQAFRDGKDMYKVQASSIFHIPYEDVTKAERQIGKVGELSCGYGAGGGAVARFASKMGIEMTDEEALKLVRDWRDANPEITELWKTVDELIHNAIASKQDAWADLAHGLRLGFLITETPKTLAGQHPGAQTLTMRLLHWSPSDGTRTLVLERTFQGCYTRGRNICYYKPSERKSGDLWVSHFTDPKTKQPRFYEVYGGKLVGILVQSLCREMFFNSMSHLENALEHSCPNAKLIGQFHDELVVEWTPAVHPTAGKTLNQTLQMIEFYMSRPPAYLAGFPLEADVKHAHRYIK